jgi:predicted GIY-YIG superfamily endonuclease
MLCERCKKEALEEQDRFAIAEVVKQLVLADLPSVSVSKILSLPTCQAVYFVFDATKIYYVGAAVDLFARWKYHNYMAQVVKIPSVRIAWLETPTALRETEKEAIKKFKPLWNGGGLRRQLAEEYARQTLREQ